MVEEKSIIQIIQKMVQDNEPEQNILDTLKTLGVEESQAKRLLLIAQADTFTLLQSEIGKLVSTQIEAKKNQIESDSKKFIDLEMQAKKLEMAKEFEKEMLKNKLSLAQSQKQFQDSVSESISRIAKLNEESFLMSEENKKMIGTVQRDLSETKLKGIKLRRSLMRNILIAFGLVCFALAIGVIIQMLYSGPFNIDFITGAAILSLIGIGIIYLTSNL